MQLTVGSPKQLTRSIAALSSIRLSALLTRTKVLSRTALVGLVLLTAACSSSGDSIPASGTNDPGSGSASGQGSGSSGGGSTGGSSTGGGSTGGGSTGGGSTGGGSTGGGSTGGGSTGGGTTPATSLPPSAGGSHSPNSLPVGDLPTIQLTSDAGGSSVPFTVGQIFREGDVPAGMSVTANTSDFQAVVRNRWADGSVKSAVLSGRAALSAGQAADLRLSKQAGATSESPISLADLVTFNPQATVNLAPVGSVSISSVINAPFKQTVSGSEMSEWIFRQSVGSDPHLVVWWRVRYYGGNDLDVLVGVENGYLLEPNPTKKDYTATVTVNGTVRFSGAVQHFHRTRWAQQYWYSADPQLTPSHDGQYLTDTKLFPNYGWRNPASSKLDELSADLTPFARNDFPSVVGTPGYHPSIGLLPVWDVFYVITGDERAWHSMIANSFSYGRYGLHYRDETTQKPPSLADHPNLVLSGTTGLVTGGSTLGQYAPGASQSGIPAFKTSHHPAPPYVAALLTGEWWFTEQVQFAATANIMQETDSRREFARGLIKTEASWSTRGAGWALKTLAMAITVTPDSDPIRAEFQRQWSENVKFYADRYVRGSVDGGAYVNNLGIPMAYSANGYNRSAYNSGSGSFWDGAFMQGFVDASIGFAWDMQLEANADDHRIMRDWLYKRVVGLLGDAATGWDYRRSALYDIPVSKTESQVPPTYFSDFKEMYDFYEAFKGLTPLVGVTDTAIRDHSADSIASGSSSANIATGYSGNMQPGRAYAVEHGAPGALAGYSRLINASNYDSLTQSSENSPVWGVVPRQ